MRRVRQGRNCRVPAIVWNKAGAATPICFLNSPLRNLSGVFIVALRRRTPHEAVPVPELRPAALFREHALRKLRVHARLSAGARDRYRTVAGFRAVDGARGAGPALSLLRQRDPWGL